MNDRAESVRVLLVTSEWPTPLHPDRAPFIARQADALRAAGASVDVFPFRGAGNPINYARSQLAVRDRLRAARYDVVHAAYGQSGLTVLPTKHPLVVTFHGSDLEGVVGPNGRYTTMGKILQQLSRVVARVADEVVVVSRALARQLPRGIRFHVVPTGVDLETFRPIDRTGLRQSLGLPTDRTLILFSGNPDVPVKRYGLAQRAVSQLGEKAELIIVRGLTGPEVCRYMNASDALLVTSKHEGCCVMVTEALACDLPVVSLPVADVPELLHGLAGCDVPSSDDADAIASSLRRVIARTEPFIGRTAVTDLDEHKLAQRTVEIYRSAIDRRRVRA